jgi:hypothetical protein
MLSFDTTQRCFLLEDKQVTLSASELALMHSLHWRQKIPFSPSIQSPGYFRCADLMEKHYLDTIQLKGRSVLGVGCNEGFPLYLAEALGASRVVGITDDCGLYPKICEARDFTRRTLRSKVEFLDIPLDTLSVESVGEFDVVFCLDTIPNVYDPYGLLARLVKIANQAVILGTPVILAPPDVAQLHLFETHGGTGNHANCVGVTEGWLRRALGSLGYIIAKGTLWEKDYLTACVMRRPDLPATSQVSIEQLPTDQGMEERTAVLMMSCEKYQQVWRPFFELFFRYWPDCPYKVYFGTDRGSYPGVETIALGVDHHWAGNVLAVTERIPAEKILLFQEDFLLSDPVDTTRVRQLVRHAFDHHVASLRFVPFPPPTSPWHGTDFLGQVGRFDDFRFSFQLTLWDKEYYRSLMVPGEDPWTTEFVAARRSVTSHPPFLAVQPWNNSPIPYLQYAIDQGEWQEPALALLRREGISLEGITRRVR